MIFTSASDLRKAGYTKHHTAYTQGYLSRKIGSERITPYHGRSGVGYIVERPCFTSTRFHFIDYYIKEEAKR